MALGLHEVDIVPLAHQMMLSLIRLRGCEKITADPCPQVLCLAYVDHPAGLVLKQIYARASGELAADLLPCTAKKLSLSLRKLVGCFGRFVWHRSIIGRQAKQLHTSERT